MDIDEVWDRIFYQHRRLIVAVVVVTLGVFLFFLITAETTYTSSARIVLGTTDPQSVAEATANADTARGIATSEDVVNAALASAGIKRDPVKLAKKDINVEPIGSSGVLKLSVTDRDPSAAVSLANALTTQVIATSQRVSLGAYAQIQPALQERIKTLDGNIASLRSEIKALDQRIGLAADAGSQAALKQTRQQAAQVLTLLTQERSDLLVQLPLTPDALGPSPAIIQVASKPVKPDPSKAAPLVGLGLMLGLVLATGTAAAVETIRPRFVGSRRIAAALKTRLLADLPASEAARGASVIDGAQRLLLVARLADVTNAEVLAVAPTAIKTDALAALLDGELHRIHRRRRRMMARAQEAPVQDGAEPRRSADGETGWLRVGVFDPGIPEERSGVVLLAPGVASKALVDEANAFVELSKKPVLGVIVDEMPPSSVTVLPDLSRARAQSSAAAKSRDGSPSPARHLSEGGLVPERGSR